MKNKFVKGIVKSTLALSLALASLSTLAGVGSPPTDIGFGLPVDIVAGSDLIEVGGPGNFGILAPAGASESDDGVAAIDVSSVMDSGFNFYGTTYNAATQFHVSSNAHVNFGPGYNSYNMPLAGWNDPTRPLFMVHREDPSTEDQVAGPASIGGNSTGTNDVFYHLDNVNDIVTITFDDVGACCQFETTDSLTAAQVRFHDIGSGNFVVEYRYENVGWASGELLGWTAGDLVNFDENFNTTNVKTKSNIGHPGVFAWMFVNGQVVPSGAGSNKVLESSVNGTAIGALTAVDPDVNDTFTYTLLDDADGRFVLAVRNGVTYVDVADGGNRLDVDDNETHDIRVKVTDSGADTFEKTLTINVIKVPAFLTTTQINVPVDEAMNVTIKTRVEQGLPIPTVTAAGLPAWMTFADNGDGTVTLSGFPSFELNFKVTLTVTDGLGNQTTRTFDINVREVNDSSNKSNSGTNGTTTPVETVEVTVTSSDGSSFGWLLVLIGGGLLARKRLK